MRRDIVNPRIRAPSAAFLKLLDIRPLGQSEPLSLPTAQVAEEPERAAA
jgi:hypothetical protein